MATLTSIFGHYSGRLGDKIYFVRNGKQYVRSVPVHSDKPATMAQLAQKQRFKLATDFASGELNNVIKIGYQGNRKLQPRNEFMRHLLKETIKGTYPDYFIDPATVSISRGDILAPGCVKAAKLRNRFVITWEDCRYYSRASQTDQLVLVLRNEEGKYYINYNLAGREDEYVCEMLPEGYTANIHAWLFYRNPERFSDNKENVSNSVYLGKF